jgi:hypothetical protein
MRPQADRAITSGTRCLSQGSTFREIRPQVNFATILHTEVLQQAGVPQTIQMGAIQALPRPLGGEFPEVPEQRDDWSQQGGCDGLHIEVEY